MKLMKKVLSLFLAINMIIVSNLVYVYADEEVETDFEQMIESLVEAGYTDETARALEYEDVKEVYECICNGMIVDVYTCAVENDILSEIEEYLSYEHEELIDMGFTEEEILNVDKKIAEISVLEDLELCEKYNIDKAQVKALRKAIEKGNQNRNGENGEKKLTKNKVRASGSITSSEMTYTQTVTSTSTTLPSYNVKLSYTWKEVYFLGVFTDKIVVAWGGNLNCDKERGTAKYYTWEDVGGDFGQLKTLYSMNVEVCPNTGIIFSFPQSVECASWSDGLLKTKSGSATFKLYQTKTRGYDTRLVSTYCHRVISISGADISFTVSSSEVGGGATLSIGGAWDTSAQKRTTISY